MLLGLTALQNLITGHANIGTGQLAGSTITTGSYNTIIGNYNNNVPNMTGNRQLNIGDLITGKGLGAGVFAETNATAQEKIKKVGIAQTSNNMSEVLDVNGTTRIRSLPKNGTINSIYTQANGSTSAIQNQTFNGINTVVADKNGVLGYIDYLPSNVKTTSVKMQNTPVFSLAGLGEFPELANEEFTYLYRLKDEPFLTKIQLIKKNGHEKQTGTQIIKRLLEAGFLEEKNDEDDKRSKRLNLTKKGEEIFHASVSMST